MINFVVQNKPYQLFALNRNILRWMVMALEFNPQLRESLAQHAFHNNRALLTDSYYLVTHPHLLRHIASGTHIILWDGVNSYLELMALAPALAQREDIHYFIVGWLPDSLKNQPVRIDPLYPANMPVNVLAWLSFRQQSWLMPAWYRLGLRLQRCLRYYKQAVTDTARHRQMVGQKQLVFCGLVCPTDAQAQGFLRGVNCPTLTALVLEMVNLHYTDAPEILNAYAKKLLSWSVQADLDTPAMQVCMYAVLNCLHRLFVLGMLHQRLGARLFVNEHTSLRRFDPYDCSGYSQHLYLDFGSTRGPDLVYPRTLDLALGGKQIYPLRLVSSADEFIAYVARLDIEKFAYQCQLQVGALNAALG